MRGAPPAIARRGPVRFRRVRAMRYCTCFTAASIHCVV